MTGFCHIIQLYSHTGSLRQNLFYILFKRVLSAVCNK